MGKFFRVAFWIAVVLGIVIGALRLVAIRWWRVPTDDPVLATSVAPTLREGDWVLLWRATAPRFGGLVICPDPDNAGRHVIGRIVGEAGDKLNVDGDNVLINERPALTETVCSEAHFTIADPDSKSEVEERCELEALGGVVHMRGSASELGRVQPGRTVTVGQGRVFLVSDNRGFPYDSRNYGEIDRSLCKESIFFRLVGKRGFMDVDSRLTYIR
jgi:signal peptidase I